ncbi:uroporphyrinogen decarboxylase family protein [Candidatus Poribacteria bacterium]|nr:uroporphyrinogen decarboxylase family protein [Candidatus Poribacteria bacterium]
MSHKTRGDISCKVEEILDKIRGWTTENQSRPEASRLLEWIGKRQAGAKAEPLIEMLAWVGREESLRPLGATLLESLRGMTLCDIISIAGRRMIFLLLGVVMARLNDTTLKKNILNPETAYQSLARTVEILQTEIAYSSVPDISAFAESYGCQVKIPEDSIPIVTKQSVHSMEDLVRCEALGPQWHDRLMNNFTILSLMAKRFTLPKLALAGGPFSMAAVLGGVETIAKKTITEPLLVERLLEFCTNVSILAGRGMVAGGADMIYIGDPTSGLLSRKLYERFAAPYVKRVVAALDVPVVLHVCGRTTHIIEQMCATGAQGISVDSAVDLPSIVSRVPRNVAIIGNLDPVGPLLNGTPEETASATKELLDKMRDVPNYMFSAGCTVALETPRENLLAMIETVKNYQ